MCTCEGTSPCAASGIICAASLVFPSMASRKSKIVIIFKLGGLVGYLRGCIISFGLPSLSFPQTSL